MKPLLGRVPWRLAEQLLALRDGLTRPGDAAPPARRVCGLPLSGPGPPPGASAIAP